MRILIIGGNGQLGRSLGDIAPGSFHISSVDLPELDVTLENDVARLVSEEKPDVVINASAYTAVDKAETDADLAFAINADGPRHLALAAKKAGARLVHVSTDYVFDGTACTPYAPDAPCSPLGVYGQSKRRGEEQVMALTDNYVIIRTSWLYSRYGGNFVLTMLRLMAEKDELRVVNDQVGSPTWAKALAEAVWAAVQQKDLNGIYHFSDAGVASWYDFSVAIQEEAAALNLIDREIPIHPVSSDEFRTVAKRPSYSVMDAGTLHQALKTTPTHWRRSLRKMLSEL